MLPRGGVEIRPVVLGRFAACARPWPSRPDAAPRRAVLASLSLRRNLNSPDSIERQSALKSEQPAGDEVASGLPITGWGLKVRWRARVDPFFGRGVPWPDCRLRVRD